MVYDDMVNTFIPAMFKNKTIAYHVFVPSIHINKTTYYIILRKLGNTLARVKKKDDGSEN